MTYLAVLCVTSFIGIFLPSLLIYSLVIVPIIDKKNIEQNNKNKFVSFNIFSLLILLLEAYNSSWKLSSFYIVMFMNLFSHWILSIDKIRQYVR